MTRGECDRCGKKKFLSVVYAKTVLEERRAARLFLFRQNRQRRNALAFHTGYRVPMSRVADFCAPVKIAAVWRSLSY